MFHEAGLISFALFIITTIFFHKFWYIKILSINNSFYLTKILV